jgi:cyclic pyranopterin phosphate synthase
MLDNFGRKINYLRISVTDRCNLRCFYCMPPEGVNLCAHHEVLSFEEIVEIVKVGVSFGIDKIRLTGGEPLVRRDIIKLVEMLAPIDGIKDFAMTTNGILLAKYAKSLVAAGLHRVNVSLDTTDPQRFSEITAGGNLNDVFAGIDAALAWGLTPVKINCVYASARGQTPLSYSRDAELVKKFAEEKGLEVRFIHLMQFDTGTFSQVEGGSGGDCKNCNRLRLLSNGKLLSCLFSDLYFDVRKLGPREAFRQAVAAKPVKGQPCSRQWMGEVGG